MEASLSYFMPYGFAGLFTTLFVSILTLLLLLFWDRSGLRTWLFGLIDRLEPLLSKIRVLRWLLSLEGRTFEEPMR